MATYGGVTLGVQVESSHVPLWTRPVTINRRKVPSSGKEEVQSAGLGNWTITVRAKLNSTTDLATLMDSQGTTKRDLTSFLGSNYTGTVMLVGISEPQAVVGPSGAVNAVLATLTFEREA